MSKKKAEPATANDSMSKEMLVLNPADDHSIDFTVSENGEQETAIFMHSRMGIRIEFNVHRSTLSLWISPQAGKSVSYHDRNFSCRDDHTSIFDTISFPEIAAKDFISCDYDPFHSVLNYGNQKLHIVGLLDKPAILIWGEREVVIDFKSDKQDTIVHRTPKLFCMRHPDRGKSFDFVVALGAKRGGLVHQPEVDQGRSTYARAILAPEQLMVVAGELAHEKVESVAKAIASKPIASLLTGNEKKIAQALIPGTIALKGYPEMQKLYDMNKRHLLSAMDASGAIHAALKYIYYLIWTTDGSVTSTSMIQTGCREFLTNWLEFLLANPTSQQAPPHGRFYGQLANGVITKREEFGSLCAVWAAFMHWGLTGDKKFVSGKYLKLLEEVVDWLDRYCWDPKVGGLGTFYFGGGDEDPFYGSNDFGWDSAVGRPGARSCYAPRHDGQLVLRAYEFGMNLNHYNMYLMLSVLTTGAQSAAYTKKARTVEQFLLKLLDENAIAYYLLDGKGLTKIARKKGEVEQGYLAVQSRSPAFFLPRFAELFMNRMKSFKPFTAESVYGTILSYVYGPLAGLDTEFVDERDIIETLNGTLERHITPSKFMPMAYTMVEVLGVKAGEYHDIRPQAFAAGPFQAAITNLSVRTMPFGIALRGTNMMSELKHFEYLGGHLDIQYRGSGFIAEIRLNRAPLEYTLQVPDSRVKKGANEVAITLSQTSQQGPLLVYSTVRLEDVSVGEQSIKYALKGYCQNVLIFRSESGDVGVVDAKGKTVEVTCTRKEKYLFVEFEGKGDFIATIGKETK